MIDIIPSFLINKTIPEIKEKPRTILGIAKQPHYENVWSNIYAFYFDTEAEHGLKDLFINSLVRITTVRLKIIQNRQKCYR